MIIESTGELLGRSRISGTEMLVALAMSGGDVDTLAASALIKLRDTPPIDGGISLADSVAALWAADGDIADLAATALEKITAENGAAKPNAIVVTADESSTQLEDTSEIMPELEDDQGEGKLDDTVIDSIVPPDYVLSDEPAKKLDEGSQLQKSPAVPEFDDPAKLKTEVGVELAAINAGPEDQGDPFSQVNARRRRIARENAIREGNDPESGLVIVEFKSDEGLEFQLPEPKKLNNFVLGTDDPLEAICQNLIEAGRPLADINPHAFYRNFLSHPAVSRVMAAIYVSGGTISADNLTLANMATNLIARDIDPILRLLRKNKIIELATAGSRRTSVITPAGLRVLYFSAKERIKKGLVKKANSKVKAPSMKDGLEHPITELASPPEPGQAAGKQIKVDDTELDPADPNRTNGATNALEVLELLAKSEPTLWTLEQRVGHRTRLILELKRRRKLEGVNSGQDGVNTKQGRAPDIDYLDPDFYDPEKAPDYPGINARLAAELRVLENLYGKILGGQINVDPMPNMSADQRTRFYEAKIAKAWKIIDQARDRK